MTKYLLLTLTFVLVSLSLSAHIGGHGKPSKKWSFSTNQKAIRATFVKYEDNKVWLADDQHQTVTYPFAAFSTKDQAYIRQRQATIEKLNGQAAMVLSFSTFLRLSFLLGGLLVVLSMVQFSQQKRAAVAHLTYGAVGLLMMVLVSCEEGGTSQEGSINQSISANIPANDLSFMQSIFGKFAGVTTTSDDTYFYIASNGLPDHPMMVGITNWQQQVPINHNYTGNNSWAIPIQPKLAAEPLSTKTNLLKGAIAVAVNGIPIFNPLNNRGEDANAIGELDNYGGHCGRADDYHYHLPPTHLQATVGEGKPVAYALDGFPVYGETTEPLDEYLGRFNADSSYQYHAVKEYPYLIAGMRGMVELDPKTRAPENQITPQAKTRGVRPALRPLRGAAITDFQQTGTDAYSLTYTVNAATHVINYQWDENGEYTFEFVDPDGTSNTERYQRKARRK